ncbi:jg11056 [Pararge aegeria aegeria]|uniref:Jg11056 protein n=1 Tax=Pararge aegeria aegeria TaxID=348720 RepID=A0A8S4R629_9NEOP|nr:jg11056 [Pararge aegeria aegeria]
MYYLQKRGSPNNTLKPLLYCILKFKVNVDYNEPQEVQLKTSRRRHHDNKKALRIRNDHLLDRNRENLRIRGGNTTDTKNFPYIAAIIINGRLWCAGTIVDVNWVLTAAHCLNYVLHVAPMKTLGRYVKVRVGSAHPHEGGQLVDVAGAVRHPKFEEEPVPHADIALLKLAENLEFQRHINLIRIYDGMKEPYAQSFVSVTGWGATRNYLYPCCDLRTHVSETKTGLPRTEFERKYARSTIRPKTGSDTAFRDHTPDLMTARLKVRTRGFCSDAYQLVSGFQFTPDFFCASLREGIRDACLFDAGAPAVQYNRLLGVMSFGPERCGHTTQPAVFIKAFYFRDFVKHTISSYKTTAELIEAMKDIDPVVRPPVHIRDDVEAVQNPEEVTQPDNRHD